MLDLKGSVAYRLRGSWGKCHGIGVQVFIMLKSYIPPDTNVPTVHPTALLSTIVRLLERAKVWVFTGLFNSGLTSIQAQIYKFEASDSDLFKSLLSNAEERPSVCCNFSLPVCNIQAEGLGFQTFKGNSILRNPKP